MICLAKKIKMVDERPTWQKDVICYGCFACINFCPEQAIQIKSTWYLKSHTDENGRYHHPELSAIDLEHLTKKFSAYKKLLTKKNNYEKMLGKH
jgi:Fe-S-cluster-containing hydrogenase component 2